MKTDLFHASIGSERAILGILQLIQLDVAPKGVRSACFVRFGEVEKSRDVVVKSVALRRMIEINGYAELSRGGGREGESESFFAERES